MELEKYYDIAPNSYLKEFAVISYLTKEYGDRKQNGASLYLKNVNNITQEMQLEILKRDRRRKKFTDYNSLKEYLKKDFQYHYWSKSECEIMIGSLGEDDIDKFEKIDMYRQIEMNLDRITEYVIDVMQFRF